MKNWLEDEPVEPIYKYVRGQGWVATPPVRAFPNQALDTLCNNCGKRAGKHKASGYNCPDGDWYFSSETWA